MRQENWNIIAALNDEQQAAVSCINGASLILAGAGSGKTRVLTCKIAMIIETGCAPWEVLALTFTKKAASEMKERIARMVGEEKARYIKMGTFHSMFAKFLRLYADKLGYPTQFTIYDTTDSKNVIKQCIKELELDDKIYKPNTVLGRISAAKNGLMTVNAYRASNCVVEDQQSRLGRIVDIYDLYSRKCKTAGAMDFDDLLLNTNILFRDFPDALAEISSKFKYILVDEYQDTNFAQMRILIKLAAPHENLTVVGDDSQSIYGFRGARIQNILEFSKVFPKAHIFRLQQNYRSSQVIVNAANSLISHNIDRLQKTCFSTGDKGEKIRLVNAFTDQEEGYMVAASIIERIYSDKSAYKDFAILYRTNAQSRIMEEALRKRNLPYRIYAGLSFFERAEIKDMISYFRLCINPLDNEAFRRVVNVPARKIGDTTLARLADVAAAHNISLLDAVLLKDEELAKFDLKSAVVGRLRDFVHIIEECNRECEKTDAFEMATKILNNSGYWTYMLSDTSIEGKGRMENVESLMNGIKTFCETETERRLSDEEAYLPEDVVVTLNDYVQNITLQSEVDVSDEESENKIALMTIHTSKGLEFPHVYVVGMEENLFPNQNDIRPSELEEERRLFYVAITRAMKSVTLSFAKHRMRWGKTESNAVSRFVREIDPQYIEGAFSHPERSEGTPRTFRHPERSEGSPRTFRHPERSEGSPRITANYRNGLELNLFPGQKIEHDHFGRGTIISIGDNPSMKTAVIRFENGETKTIALKFAKLSII